GVIPRRHTAALGLGRLRRQVFRFGFRFHLLSSSWVNSLRQKTQSRIGSNSSSSPYCVKPQDAVSRPLWEWLTTPWTVPVRDTIALAGSIHFGRRFPPRKILSCSLCCSPRRSCSISADNFHAA